jgi:hypothetical protein
MPRPNVPTIPPGALELARQVSSSDEAMPYEVTIADPDSTGTFNTGTGVYTTVSGTEHYTELGARIHPVPLNERQVTVAGEAQQLSRYYVRLPLGTEVLENQRITVTAARSAYCDATMVGRTLRVLDHTPRVFATELRITCQEEPVPAAE